MAGGVVGNNQEIWRAFLAATYFNIPADQCPTCKNGGGECGKYFCVQCKVGNVCEVTFNAGGEHAQHPRIRVWKVTGVSAVCADDLRTFNLPEALIGQIQKYKENGRLNCKFFRRDVQYALNLRMCHGCGGPISASKTRNRSDSPVCSLQCLLDHALGRRLIQIIAALDAMPGEWAPLHRMATEFTQ